MVIIMKFKKNLFLTFCLLFSATAYPISWNGIKNKVYNATDTTLIQLANVGLSDYYIGNWNRDHNQAHTLAIVLLWATLSGAIDTWYNGTHKTADEKSVSIGAAITGALALIGPCVAIECTCRHLISKATSIGEKIKDGALLSDNEILFFSRAIRTQIIKTRIHRSKNYCGILSTQPNHPDYLMELCYEKHIINAIHHPQLNSNPETIDTILEYVLSIKNEISYECFRELLPLVEKHGADYIKRNGLDTNACNFYAQYILYDRVLAQYIEKYGTAQENSKMLTSLIQNLKFRPRTIKALSKKNDVEDASANLKRKLLSTISHPNIAHQEPYDLFLYDELISTFPEIKNDIAKKILNRKPNLFNGIKKQLIIDDGIENTKFFQEINDQMYYKLTEPKELLDFLITSDNNWLNTTFGEEAFAHIKEKHPSILRNKLMAHLRTTSGLWHIAFIDYLLTEHPNTKEELETLLQQKKSLECLQIHYLEIIYYGPLGSVKRDSCTANKNNYPTALTFGRRIQQERYIKGKEKRIECPFG